MTFGGCKNISVYYDANLKVWVISNLFAPQLLKLQKREKFKILISKPVIMLIAIPFLPGYDILIATRWNHKNFIKVTTGKKL